MYIRSINDKRKQIAKLPHRHSNNRERNKAYLLFENYNEVQQERGDEHLI